jgi:hypothetical protein
LINLKDFVKGVNLQKMDSKVRVRVRVRVRSQPAKDGFKG